MFSNNTATRHCVEGDEAARTGSPRSSSRRIPYDRPRHPRSELRPGSVVTRVRARLVPALRGRPDRRARARRSSGSGAPTRARVGTAPRPTSAGSTRCIHYAGPNLTKKTLEKPLPQGNAVGGYYSKSMSTFEAVTVPEGRDHATRRRARLVEPGHHRPGQLQPRRRGQGRSTCTSTTGQRYVAGHFPKAKQAFFDASKSVQSVPRAAGVRADVPDVRVQGLPEQRQHDVVPAASQDLNL